MAGSKLVRFLLIRNNPSCKTPEADYPLALLPALEVLTSCLASEEDYPKAFLLASVVLASSQTSEEEHPRAFLPALEALTSCLAFEEEYPRAFLQASEVSPPPILPKKTTQGVSFKPRKSHILPYFQRRLPEGFSNLGCYRLLLFFRRRLPEGVITPRQEAAEC